MELNRPSWMKGPSEAGQSSAAEGGKRKKAEEEEEEAVALVQGKGMGAQGDLLKLIARLVLSDSRALADLTSTVYRTLEIPEEDGSEGGQLAAAVVACGKAYDDISKELKEKKKAGEDVYCKVTGLVACSCGWSSCGTWW